MESVQRGLTVSKIPDQTKRSLTGFSSDTSQPRYSATVIMWFTMQSISCEKTSSSSTGMTKPGGRILLLSARPAVTFSAPEHQHPLAGTELYCLITIACAHEQHTQSHYMTVNWLAVEAVTQIIKNKRRTQKNE